MIKHIGLKIKERRIFFIISIAIFVVDMISKYFVEAYLSKIIVKNILGDFLIFVYTRNYGVAFGMLNNVPESMESIMPIILEVLVGVSVLFVFYFMLTINPKKQKYSMIGFSLIFAGALGNFFDRVYTGYVTDFINMGLTKTIRFPYNYNIADASITIGIVTIMIATFVLKEDFDKKKKRLKSSDEHTI